MLFFVVCVNTSFASCFGALGHTTSSLVLLRFIFKSPLYSLHSWLPKAHVEAPLYGSMFLSGILLKMGGYGVLLMSPFLGSSSFLYLYLSLAGSVLCSLLCFRSWDVKTWVAYSSVVHAGLVNAGALLGTELGFYAGTSMLVSHSLVSPVLFCLSYDLYSGSSSRSFYYSFSCCLDVVTLLYSSLLIGFNFGLPPSLGFWSELSLFCSCGLTWSFRAYLLGATSFFTFLFCVFFYINTSTGPASFSSLIWVASYYYLPPSALALLSPFAWSLFCS